MSDGDDFTEDGDDDEEVEIVGPMMIGSGQGMQGFLEALGMMSPEAMQEHQEKHAMESDVETHKVYRVLEELSDEQLDVIGMMIGTVTRHAPSKSQPFVTASYDLGFLAATRYYKHGICPACGKNHADDIFGKEETDTPDGG